MRGGLYIVVRGFRRAYKRRGLYPREAYNPNKKNTLRNKLKQC